MHLIGPLVAREAAVSSKIEGTQSTSSDIYILMLVVFLLMEISVVLNYQLSDV